MNNETAVIILGAIQLLIGVVLFHKDNSFKKQLAKIQKTLNINQSKTIKFQERQLDEISSLYGEFVNLDNYFVSLLSNTHSVHSINSYLPLANLESFSISSLLPDENHVLDGLDYDLKLYELLYLKRKFELFQDKYSSLNSLFLKKSLYLPKEFRKVFVHGLSFYVDKILIIRKNLDETLKNINAETNFGEFSDFINDIQKEFSQNKPTIEIFLQLDKIMEEIFDPNEILNN